MKKMGEILESLITAAKAENRDFVDKTIPEVAQNADVRDRAIELLSDPEGDVRDLAASILTKAHLTRKVMTKLGPRLASMMVNDSHEFARYRAAFALAEHDPKSYAHVLIPILEAAVRVKDVSSIASEYLQKVRDVAT